MRSGLLFRRRDRDGADLPGELDRVEADSGGRPVAGRELEIAFVRPVRHDVDDLGQVGLGVEAVQLAAGDQGEAVRCGRGVIVLAVPCWATPLPPLQLARPPSKSLRSVVFPARKLLSAQAAPPP